MKNLGAITDPKDIITKEFLEEGIGARVNTLEDNVQMAESDIKTLQDDVQSLQTDNTTTKAAVQTLQNTYVPNTRKVNGKALDADITVDGLVWTITGDYNLATNVLSNIDKTYTEIKAAIESGYQVDIRLNIANVGVLSLLNTTAIISGSFTFEGCVCYNTNIMYVRVRISSNNSWDTYNTFVMYGEADGNYTADGARIIQLADPVNAQDGATKNYVDNGVILWAIYNQTPFTVVDGAFKAGKKIFLTFANNDNIEAVAQLVAVEGNAYIFINNKLGTIYSYIVTSDGWSEKNLGRIVPSAKGDGTDEGKVPVANAIGDYGLKKLTASDVGALSLNGGSMSGAITGLPMPTSNSEATNKAYVDGLAIYTTIDHIILTTAWVTNTNSQASTREKTDFPFMTTISLANVTTDYCVDVLFSYDDQISGNFCPCVYSVADGVIVEAKEKPSDAITIPVIRYWKPIVQQPSSGGNTP